MGYVHRGCGANKAAERGARLVYPVGGAAPRPHSVGFETAFARIIEAGIIDPTKMRVALENAVSLASVLLLTEAMLTDIPEEKSNPQPGRFSEK